jgi:hypothetical protein
MVTKKELKCAKMAIEPPLGHYAHPNSFGQTVVVI